MSMRGLLVVSLGFATACVGDATGVPSDNGNPPPPPPGASTHFTSDTTIGDARQLSGRDNVIEAGVTVTVTSGAALEFASNASLEVLGTLLIEGAADAVVNIRGVDDQPNYDITVGATGTLDMSYGVLVGGAHRTAGGATVSITDSLMFGSPLRDLLTMNGGTVTIEFSQLGAPAGAVDATHCNLHLGGAGNTLVVNNSILHGTPFNLMLYAGTNLDLKNNNWTCGPNGAADCAGHVDIDTQPGVSADLTGSFFEKGDPVPGVEAELLVSSPRIDTPLVNVGVRPAP
jgi:hypothetical protein